MNTHNYHYSLGLHPVCSTYELCRSGRLN